MLAAGASATCGEAAPSPNIVIIYVDDLGWRDVGIMGTEYYETPNVDALASQGMLFTSAYANAPNCAPSRASLLTGFYAPRHGVYTVNSAARGDTRLRRLIPVDNRTDLDTAFVTIAEALQTAGYVTGHVGKWHLGSEGSLPTDHGFDWAVAGDHLGFPASYFFPYENATRRIPDLGSRGKEGEYLTDRLTAEALGFIQANAGRSFFLYLSHYAVHTPLRAKPDLIEYYQEKAAASGHDNPIYAAMVHSVDESVGRVMDMLDELDLTSRTVVVFYSDNGGYGPATSMAPLRGSKGMLYEGGIRVPLVIRWPGHVAPGSRSDDPVIGTDLFPTLLDIANVPNTARDSTDGLSLLPLLGQKGDSPDRPLFWHFPAYLEAYRSLDGPWRTTPVSAIRMGNYKLITFFEDGHTELYDLSSDIGEQRDISTMMPEKTAELDEQLRLWWQRVGAWIPSVLNPEFEPDADEGN